MKPTTRRKLTCRGLPKRGSSFGRLVRDGAIVLGISLFLIGIIEMVLRSFFPQIVIATPIQGEHFSIADDIMGMRYVPGARWRFKHPEYTVEYAINADGFRDTKPHPVPKPVGTIRVLLLGDSFTFGQGTNYDQTWAVLVERLLEESGNSQIDLVKAGIQAMDTRSEFILMQELIKKYQADAIVIGFLMNDVDANSLHGIEREREASAGSDSHGRAPEEKAQSTDSWFKAMRHTIIRRQSGDTFQLLNLIRRLLIANEDMYCKLYLSSAWEEYLRNPWPPTVMQKVRITEMLFKKMSDFAQSLGKQLIVFSIPQQFQVLCSTEGVSSDHIDITSYDRYLSEVANQKNFVWVTTLESFKKAKQNHTKLFYRWDGHLTPAGNRVVAEVFFQRIVPLLDARQ
jgi:lysophospholipase L1-like esterase